MTQEEQVALSKRYGLEVCIVLPLENNRFAVFDASRRLFEIVDHVALANAVQRCPAAKGPEPRKRVAIDLSSIKIGAQL